MTSGATPTPPPIISNRWARSGMVNELPSGPSIPTRSPGRRSASQALPRPNGLTRKVSAEASRSARYTEYGRRSSGSHDPENLVTMLKNCPGSKWERTAGGALTVRRTASPMIGSTESTWLSNSRDAPVISSVGATGGNRSSFLLADPAADAARHGLSSQFRCYGTPETVGLYRRHRISPWHQRWFVPCQSR